MVAWIIQGALAIGLVWTLVVIGQRFFRLLMGADSIEYDGIADERQLPSVALGLGVGIVTLLHFFTSLLPLVWWRMTSDILYLPMLVADMVHGTGSLEGWSLTPAPYLFPDFVITYGLYWLLGDMDLTIVLGAATNFGIVLAAVGMMVWHLAGRRTLSTVLVVLALANVLIAWRPPTLAPFFALSFHAAAAALALVSMQLALRVWQDNSVAARVLLALVGFCTAYSDPLYIINFTLPMIGTTCLAWLRWPNDLVRASRTVAYTLVPPIVAYLVSLRFYIGLDPRHMSVLTPLLGEFFDLRIWPRLWDVGLLVVANMTPGGFVFALVGLAVSVLTTHRLWRTTRRRVPLCDPGEFFLPATMLAAVIVTLVVTVLREPMDVWFQLHYMFILPVVVFAMTAIELVRFCDAGLARLATHGVLASLCALLVTLSIGSIVIHYTPPWVTALMAKRHELGLRDGLGHYWNAKWISFFSRGALWVNQIDPQGNVQWWINNVDWYTRPPGSDTQPEYNFICMENLSKPDIARRFGQPAEVVIVDGRELWLYRGDNLMFDIVTRQAREERELRR